MMHASLPLAVLACVALAPAQELGFAASSITGTSGSVCDPFSCTPATMTAVAGPSLPSGASLQLQITGAAAGPFLLLLALPPAQCLGLPGFGNGLILTPPGTASLPTFAWGHFPSGTCSTWFGFSWLTLPASLPTGTQFLMQGLAPVDVGGTLQWTFSKAIAVTTV